MTTEQFCGWLKQDSGDFYTDCNHEFPESLYEYYHIRFCPFCGEQIYIRPVSESWPEESEIDFKLTQIPEDVLKYYTTKTFTV